MFEDADNFADIFRGGLPFYVLITIPILLICSSNPVLASSEFNVQRMTQYDLHGNPLGCRASALNLEAKSLQTWSTPRHCIFTRFQDLTVEQFQEIRSKAGGLVILLPECLTKLSVEQRQRIYALENAMLLQDISIPVYFSKYNAELETVVSDLSRISLDEAADTKQAGKRESALESLINSVSANGYQAQVTGTTHSPNKQSKINIIQGELIPVLPAQGSDTTKLPSIIITAHIDTLGLFNDQLNSADAAVFFTLIDTFSKVYSSHGMSPKYRILFLLTESGSLLNFQGTKKWLESNVDDNNLLQSADFVLCLDALGKKGLSDLFMHVSKPPKEGTSINNFYKLLKQNAQRYGDRAVEGVHKKINLAEVSMAWEHERFSMKRVPAFTISNVKNYKDPLRNTIFSELKYDQSLDVVAQNAKILAETLADYVYRNDSVQFLQSDKFDAEIFSGTMAITANSIRPWYQMRSMMVNSDVKNAFSKYLKNVKVTVEKPDAREPDFLFYDGYNGVLNIYSVKPAVFDLFLTIVIVAYLSGVYFAILYFEHFYNAICKLSNNNKTKSH